MVAGYWWSEKLDGHRGFWDGGISRGFDKSEVPWANTAKDERYIEAPIATGLWSRYGNVIHAPDWWLDQLPKMLLDGELWNGKRGDGNRQEITSIVKKICPDDLDWKSLWLMAFDSPPFNTVFANGYMDNIHFQKKFENIYAWTLQNCYKFTYDKLFKKEAKYRSVYHALGEVLNENEVAERLEQHELSFSTMIADKEIEAAISQIGRMKGEGLMIRNPDKYWEAERSYNILKVKKYDDAEGIVLGYTTGRKTDKGSKLLGLMGAMIVEWNGNVFELSGFTESERILTHENYASLNCEGTGTKIAREWAIKNPEKECPNWITSILFPRGFEVTFRYRGLTKDGIPNEASYWRRGEKF
jgi:DNA ligase-1